MDRRDFLRWAAAGSVALLTGAHARRAWAASAGQEPEFVFVALGDTHVGSSGDAARLAAAAPYVAAEAPAFVLHVGDVVNDRIEQTADVRRAQRLLADLPRPLFVVPGNHDIPWRSGRDDVARWTDAFGAERFVHEHRGWRVVGFNSLHLTGPAEGSEAEPALRAWLEETVPPAAGTARTVLVHHAPAPSLPRWLWRGPEWTTATRAWWHGFLASRRPAAVLCGHWHLGVRLAEAGVPLFVTPPVSGRGALPTGYLRCAVRGDALLVERVMLETEGKRRLPGATALILLPQRERPAI